MGSEHTRLPETTSTRLGELLKFRDDHRNNLTLGTILNLNKRSSPGIRSSRTLLDIIQEDSTGESKITWRNFRDNLRLKHASTAIQGAHSINNSLGSLLTEEEENETEGEGPVRMSLMSFLADTDGEIGNDLAHVMEDDEGEVKVENDEGGNVNDCCVCMVRHKGSAFIPCGHTFCRLCSREVYVQRGNCPICNGFILEILDIF